MRTCKQPPATPESPSRIFRRDWKRSAARGNEKGIRVPPPGGLKFRGENHHEITVVAPYLKALRRSTAGADQNRPLLFFSGAPGPYSKTLPPSPAAAGSS